MSLLSSFDACSAGLKFEDKPSYALLSSLLQAVLLEAERADQLHERRWPWYELTPGVKTALAEVVGFASEETLMAAASAAVEAAAESGAEPTLPSNPPAASLAMYLLPPAAQARVMAANLGAQPSNGAWRIKMMQIYLHSLSHRSPTLLVGSSCHTIFFFALFITLVNCRRGTLPLRGCSADVIG